MIGADPESAITAEMKSVARLVGQDLCAGKGAWLERSRSIETAIGGDPQRSAPNETKNGQAVNGARTDL